MGKFHVRPEAVNESRVVFDQEETRHLVRVLRLGPGDLIQAMDGKGTEYTIRLESVEGRSAAGTILTRSSLRIESPLAITLAQGVPKGEKMEWIVKAATELGVARIVPLLTRRCVVRLQTGRERARRWQRVAKEAAKQSGRSAIPVVEAPRVFDEFLAECPPADLAVCLWERERRGLREILGAIGRPVVSALLVVGPEGGLAPEEVEKLKGKGLETAGLGPRILRTETAAPIGIALLQARWGDLGQTTP